MNPFTSRISILWFDLEYLWKKCTSKMIFNRKIIVYISMVKEKAMVFVGWKTRKSGFVWVTFVCLYPLRMFILLHLNIINWQMLSSSGTRNWSQKKIIFLVQFLHSHDNQKLPQYICTPSLRGRKSVRYKSNSMV